MRLTTDQEDGGSNPSRLARFRAYSTKDSAAGFYPADRSSNLRRLANMLPLADLDSALRKPMEGFDYPRERQLGIVIGNHGFESRRGQLGIRVGG